jgi:hypothetical protein
LIGVPQAERYRITRHDRLDESDPGERFEDRGDPKIIKIAREENRFVGRRSVHSHLDLRSHDPGIPIAER